MITSPRERMEVMFHFVTSRMKQVLLIELLPGPFSQCGDLSAGAISGSPWLSLWGTPGPDTLVSPMVSAYHIQGSQCFLRLCQIA